MVKKIKRMLSLLSAAAMAVTMSAFTVPSSAVESTSDVIFQDECENLTLNGLTVWKDIHGRLFPGYSGEGFVYLTSGSMEFTVDVPEDGMYEINTSYIQVLDEATKGPRTQTISINGAKFKLDFPYANTWTDKSFGIFRLNKGENTIQLLPEYGYASFDTITVKKATLPELKIQPTLSDTKATKETQGLMNYLCDMYGNHIISGQQEIYGGGHTEDSPNGYSGNELLGYESEFEWINKNFGAYPAIRGFDYMNYNPLYGWDDGTTERIIEWGTRGENGGIPTVCWHINIPNDFTNYKLGEAVDWSKCSYKPNSTFKVANATVEGTKEYEFMMLAIDDIAQELLKTQEAGIPIIFRPYHEAEGNPGVGNAWFWWGQEGAEPYKALWKQLYTTLTKDYGIHNLIWEFNSYTYSSSPEWYPGDDCVDMVGFDKYNTVHNRTDGLSGVPNEDAISGTFYNLVNLTNNKKLVAMPENDTVPSVENMIIEKANWLYFCVWYDNGSDNFLSDSARYNNFDTLKSTYESDYCITFDELPDWKNYKSQGDIDPTEPTTDSDIDFIPGDITADEKVNVFDSIGLRRHLLSNRAYPFGANPYDTNGDGNITVADYVLLNQWLVGKDVEITYYKTK